MEGLGILVHFTAIWYSLLLLCIWYSYFLYFCRMVYFSHFDLMYQGKIWQSSRT
jgi:hypothetical protein